MGLKERAKQLKVDIPAVFIALTATETPFLAKIFAGLTVLYALSPIDLIPDFIPFFGMLDDLILLPLFITLTIKWIPKAQFELYREQSRNLWLGGRPKKWYYALPFVLVWVLLITLILRLIF